MRSAAETFRANKDIDVVEAITSLGVGEALISVLDEKGMPTPVEIALVYPPKSQLTPLTETERSRLMKQDDLYSHYSAYVDNESAFEVLNAQSQAVQSQGQTANTEEEKEGFLGGMLASIFGSKKKKDQSLAEQIVSQVAQQVGRNLRNQVTKQIMRGLLGAIIKK